MYKPSFALDIPRERKKLTNKNNSTQLKNKQKKKIERGKGDDYKNNGGGGQRRLKSVAHLRAAHAFLHITRTSRD